MDIRTIPWRQDPVVRPRSSPLLARLLKRRFGVVPEIAPYLYSVPWLAKVVGDFGVYQPDFLGMRLSGYVSFCISQENSCKHCYGQIRAALGFLGFPPEYVDQLEDDATLFDQLQARDKFFLDLSRRITKGFDLPTQAEMQASAADVGVSPREVIEFVFFVAVKASFNSRLATPLALPESAEERLSRIPMVRLLIGLAYRVLAPLMAGRLVSRILPEWDEPSLPRGEHFGQFLAGFSDYELPKRLLTRAIGQALHSPTTEFPLKALVFLTVGLGLSSNPLIFEGHRMALSAGISEADILAFSKSLRFAKMSRLELAAVDLARETIRYSPERIQAVCAAFLEVASEEVLVEVLGLSALANSLARMSPLVDDSRPTNG